MNGRIRGNAFTLIELLVVVAIIAVLVAVLLPALTQARGRAKTMVCLGNLKSQSSAVMTYEADYAVYPPMAWGDWQSPWDLTVWGSYLYPYLTGGAKVRLMVPGAWGDVAEVTRLRVFVCPAATASCLAITQPAEPGIWGILYGYADGYHEARRLGDRLPAWLRASTFSRPSEIRMICDCDLYWTTFCPYCAASGWMLGTWLAEKDRPAFGRHLAGLNVAFWDGHAAPPTNEDVWSNLVMHGHYGL